MVNQIRFTTFTGKYYLLRVPPLLVLKFGFGDISDDAAASASELFLAFLSNCARITNAEIQLVCSEKPPTHYLPCAHENIKTVDVIAEPSEWCEITGSQFRIPSLTSLFSDKDLTNTVVFIDSVSPFLWCHGLTHFTREITHLASSAKRIVLGVHSDTLLGESDAVFLESLCTTHVNVAVRYDASNFLVTVTCKKSGGKVLGRRQAELVTIAEDGSVNSSVSTAKVERSQPRVVPMDSLTTFNLGVSMSEAEKKARDHLVLPYLRYFLALQKPN